MDIYLEIDWAAGLSDIVTEIGTDSLQGTLLIISLCTTLMLILTILHYLLLLKVSPYIWEMSVQYKLFILSITSLCFTGLVITFAVSSNEQRLAISITACLVQGFLLYSLRKLYEEVT